MTSACGSDASDRADAAAPDDPIEITAIDYAFVGVPESVPAGTELTLVNDSAVEVHELVAVRLPDDEDRPVAEEASEEVVAVVGDGDTVLGDERVVVGDPQRCGIDPYGRLAGRLEDATPVRVTAVHGRLHER